MGVFVKQSTTALIAIAASALVQVTSQVQAAIDVVMMESGNDVVATFSGSLDLTGLEYEGIEPGGAQINGAFDGFLFSDISPSDAMHDVYSGVSSPEFPSMGALADSSEGDFFGIIGTVEWLFLPVGYESGDMISGSMRFNDMGLMTIGLIAGEYLYEWRTDSVLVTVIGGNPVPVPAAGLLMLPGLLGWRAFKMRRAA